MAKSLLVSYRYFDKFFCYFCYNYGIINTRTRKRINLKAVVKMSRKIKISVAREIYKNAKNNGERREAQTLAELYATGYNPTAPGDEVGDIETPNGTQIQVKCFDGVIPGETTGNIVEDLEIAFMEDASPIWAIWFNEKYYILIEKWDLFNHIAKNPEDLIRYNMRDGKQTLRLKIGMQKRKFFFNHPGMRVATKKM